MLRLIGSTYNFGSIVTPHNGEPLPTPYVEVVLIGHAPTYGFTKEGIGKSSEVVTQRFTASPQALRDLAADLEDMADKCAEVFGEYPEPQAENEAEPEEVAEGV